MERRTTRLMEYSKLMMAQREAKSGYTLTLSNADPLKNWLLELFIGDNNEDEAMFELASNFRYHFMTHLNKQVHAFLQGETSGWKLIEFWSSDQSLILDAVIECIDSFETEFGIKLDLKIV